MKNTATVSLGVDKGYVLVDGEHSSSVTTTVVCPTATIEKSATNGPVEPGGTATYDIVVTNTGTFAIPFSAIQVIDSDATTVTEPSNTDPLEPQTSRTWTATKQVPADQACGSNVENTATLDLIVNQLPRAVADSVSVAVADGQSSTATTPVNCPVQVSVTKSTGSTTVEPGGTVGYTIGVTNTGNFAVPGDAIQVSDPGATLSGPDTTGDLAPGATRTWTATKQAGADATACGTQVTNTASVFLSGLPTGYTDTGLDTRSSSATAVPVGGGICAPAPVAFRPASGVLDLVKTGPKTSLAGAKVTWQITATNTGASDLTGVVVNDNVPRTMVLGKLPAGVTRSGRTITWNVGTLASGQSVTLQLPVTLLRTVRGKACNTATAYADGTDAVGSRACTTVRVGRRPATPVTG